MTKTEPTIYVISRDGKPVDQTEELLHWFHQRHSFSMDYALQHAGYSIEGPFTEQELELAAKPDDQECDCSHATVSGHLTKHCSWDLQESRGE